MFSDNYLKYCYFQEGVVGIIDGTGGRASEHIQAISDVLELPLISIQHNDLFVKNWSLVNMFPSPDAFNMVNSTFSL